MTFGGVTTVWSTAGTKEALKLLEGAERVREKQPVVAPSLQGVHIKIDLQDLAETKQSDQEKGHQIKGILSTYSEQDLIQKFF